MLWGYVSTGSTHKSRLACLSCHKNGEPNLDSFAKLKSITPVLFQRKHQSVRGLRSSLSQFMPCSVIPAFHSAILRSSNSRHTEISIPDLKAALRFSDQFPCGPDFPSLQSPHRFSFSFWEPCLMSPSPAATSNIIGILIADSNRMQAQLLTSALRRH